MSLEKINRRICQRDKWAWGVWYLLPKPNWWILIIHGGSNGDFIFLKVFQTCAYSMSSSRRWGWTWNCFWHVFKLLRHTTRLFLEMNLPWAQLSFTARNWLAIQVFKTLGTNYFVREVREESDNRNWMHVDHDTPLLFQCVRAEAQISFRNIDSQIAIVQYSKHKSQLKNDHFHRKNSDISA